jgi:acyl-coenzyme A thioesterase PaaI-like protein
MISAFLDGLLAGAAARAAGGRLVTMQLSVSFLDMARAGEWVLGDARAAKVTRDIAFVEGRALVGDRDIARATGVFKLMRPRTV